jgi:sodium-dependent dicarboxylate transporter 2/3/5
MLKDLDNSFSNSRRAILSFVICFFVALVLTILIKEPAFTDSQVYVLFLLFFAIGLWLTEAIPAFSVSLFIIAYLVFALGNPFFNSAPENIAPYAQTFSSSVIWLMLGGFFLSSAMTKTKLDQALFGFTLKVSGSKPRSLLIGLMVTTMFASMFMSNTATSAMVIAAVTPLMSSLGKNSGISKGLLLGISIAATTGGMGTVIGTPSNAIAVGVLENVGIQVDFMEWMKFGVPLALFLTAIACVALILVYMKDNSPISLDFLHKEVEIPSKRFLIQRKIVIGVIIVTVGLWLTTSLHGLTVGSICAVPLVILTLTRVLEGKDVQQLPWDTLLLVAGGLSLGLAMENTGLLSYYANKLLVMEVNSYLLIFILAYATMLFSNIMSNTATSTVMIPLGIAILIALKVEITLIIALSASTAMFLPVSTPPNAIAFSTGLVEQKDFRLGGILIGLLGPLLIILWVIFLS